MNKSTCSRFNCGGFAIGIGVGAALCASLGWSMGVPMGLGLAVVFGCTTARKC